MASTLKPWKLERGGNEQGRVRTLGKMENEEKEAERETQDDIAVIILLLSQTECFYKRKPLAGAVQLDQPWQL